MSYFPICFCKWIVNELLISGHKTDEIFRRYQIIDERDIAEACKKIADNPEEDEKLVYYSDLGEGWSVN